MHRGLAPCATLNYLKRAAALQQGGGPCPRSGSKPGPYSEGMWGGTHVLQLPKPSSRPLARRAWPGPCSVASRARNIHFAGAAARWVRSASVSFGKAREPAGCFMQRAARGRVQK